uniref:Uncharacterized protein n=1 Tax=Glossina morsitans morsitans TaxID=37546 RepID=A0A1B0FH89_GLOMM
IANAITHSTENSNSVLPPKAKCTLLAWLCKRRLNAVRTAFVQAYGQTMSLKFKEGPSRSISILMGNLTDHGWEGSSLFVSFVRLSLGRYFYTSLNASQTSYFTLACDWYLFGRQLPGRVKRGEDIMFSCFRVLKFIADDEFSNVEHRILQTPPWTWFNRRLSPPPPRQHPAPNPPNQRPPLRANHAQN